MLERISGRTFDVDALRALMDAVNTQEELFDEIRTLICAAPKTPVRMTEQITNVMATQWVRGSDVGDRACPRVPRRGQGSGREPASQPVPTNGPG